MELLTSGASHEEICSLKLVIFLIRGNICATFQHHVVIKHAVRRQGLGHLMPELSFPRGIIGMRYRNKFIRLCDSTFY
jgi:hypothetical protein